MKTHPASNNGSAMILALITITILSYIAANALRTTGVKYQTSFQAASWQEAMLGAEAGADIAIANLGSSGPSTGNGWTNVSGSLWSYPVADLTHGGTGNNTVKIAVTAEQLTSGWYRIRSTGTARVPGPARAAFDGRDAVLRKIGMKNYDPITGATIPTDGGGNLLPQVSRKIEVIVQKADSQWDKAIKVKSFINFANSGAALGPTVPTATSWVDAFDPRDSTKSTGGRYDYSKKQSGADIGMLNSTSANINNTPVLGAAYYNGPALTGTSRVTGGTITPYSGTISPVVAPWTVYPSGATLGNGSSVAATSTSSGSPTIVNTSRIALTGSGKLTITAPTTTSTYYIQINVGGKVTETASASIDLPSNVVLTMNVDGEISLTGGAISNASGKAANCTINCISPVPALALPRQVNLSGSATMYALLNAPDYDVILSGSSSIAGAVIGNSFKTTGSASLHYDLSLNSGASSPSGYVTTSWVEATASGYQK